MDDQDSNHGMHYKMLVGTWHHDNGVEGARKVQDWWEQQGEVSDGKGPKDVMHQQSADSLHQSLEGSLGNF